MKVIEKEAFKAVGIQVQGQFDDLFTKVPKAWKEISRRLEEISNREGDTMMEISLGTEGGIYTELVGTEVTGESKIPESMVEVAVPKHKYIHYRHEGPVQEIASSFGKIYDWAEQNDYEAGDFKLDYGYTKDGGETVHDLYVKILP